MVQFWGFNITRDKTKEKALDAIAPKEEVDGSTVITAGGSFGTYVEVSNVSKTEAELIQKYRDMSRTPEVDTAIEEIVNEFVDIEDEEIISLDFSPDVDEKVKKIITQEFEESLRLLDFKNSCYDIIRRWYIDGRLKYQAIIDTKNPKLGLQEVRYIDPRKLKKVKEIIEDKSNNKNNISLVKNTLEYYIYNEKGFGGKASSQDNYTSPANPATQVGIKIEKDSIIEVGSGLTDSNNQMVLSYLDKAIKPLNQLRTLEDASIIYTLARAPERRVWYIDVGDLPPMKAKQHFEETVRLHKNKVVYNAETGDVRDDRKYMTMLEDYWLPRRGDQSRGTEVTTLQGGHNMGEMGQIEYFEQKLYKALNVPTNRLNSQDTFMLGRSTQITREEVKFAKFIARLRLKFSNIFLQIIEKNLLLKNIMSIEDWNYIKGELSLKWESASYFDELKKSEILQDRANTMNIMSPFIGVFYSKKWAQKNIFMMTDEEIEEMAEQLAEEGAQELDQQINDINTINNATSGPEDKPDKEEKKDDTSSSKPSKEQKIQKARTDYNKLKHKKNKSEAEKKAFMSAAQILGRNNR